jgi:hypothetical protein
MVSPASLSPSKEGFETFEEAKRYLADPSGSSKSVGTIGYVGRANAN